MFHKLARLVCFAAVLAFSCVVFPAHSAEPGEKTLVSWVTLDEGEYSAGTALTLQRGPEFDGIVFGEVREKTWMAGSNFFERTQRDQDYSPEPAADGSLVQMAIVYGDDNITIYRNGKQLTSYPATLIDLLEGDDQLVVFGRRHIGGDGSIAGSIEDARIYAKALTVDQIRALKPNVASDIEAWAWFDFEGGEVKDRTGRFPLVETNGEVKLEDGRLVLAERSFVVAMKHEEAIQLAGGHEAPLADPSEWEGETPTMPAELPEHWVTYHLFHPGPGRAEPGDPNAAIYYKGRYHLHYIYRNRFGFCFAHLSSQDMVNWKWHETTLRRPRRAGTGCSAERRSSRRKASPPSFTTAKGRAGTWSRSLRTTPSTRGAKRSP